MSPADDDPRSPFASKIWTMTTMAGNTPLPE
jgi:hypothetical protein